MLDAGTGVYRAAEYLATPELDIFITHAHLDHVVGLTYLFSVMQVHPLRRITLHGLPENLAGGRRAPVFAAPVSRPAAVRVAAAGESFALPDGGRLTHFPLEHRGGSIGYRLDWPGHSMAYVTDTTADADAAYVAKIRGVDLLVHECYFPDAQAEWAAQDRPQPHHAGGPSRPASRRQAPGAGPFRSRSRPPTIPSGWTRPVRSFPTRSWAKIGWSWSSDS